MVKIMSLTQNMWERPLLRELREVQARISELEYQMRELWPKVPLPVGEIRDTQSNMEEYTRLLSDAQVKKYELMKRIELGRK